MRFFNDIIDGLHEAAWKVSDNLGLIGFIVATPLILLSYVLIVLSLPFYIISFIWIAVTESGKSADEDYDDLPF